MWYRRPLRFKGPSNWLEWGPGDMAFPERGHTINGAGFRPAHGLGTVDEMIDSKPRRAQMTSRRSEWVKKGHSRASGVSQWPPNPSPAAESPP
jgi:hypothetical protein